MVFWIVTALVILGTGYWIVATILDEWAETIIGAIFTVLGQLVVGFIVWILLAGALLSGIVYATSKDEFVETTSENLIALQTRDSIEGRTAGIFASTGYVEGVRVISYVTKDSDGGIRTGYVPAKDSVIYEGDSTPTLETHHWKRENGWIAPWAASRAETYTINVPEGSVVESFEVAP